MSTPENSSNSAPSPASRTMAFVGAAAVCVGITAAVEFASRPAAIEEFGRIGEEFYPEFTDPTLATGLEVYAFDKEEVIPREFLVKRQDNGRWTIPSHHDYPADAEDRLGKTAASIIGIDRGAMVTRWPADHAQYGVVNPKQDSLKIDEVDGVGKRLILTGEGGEVLADYIIGNSAGDDESGDDYYVRHPEEDEVYIATLDIDLSTKFADWIDTDMLNINGGDLRALVINDYSFNELQRSITKGETSKLSREKSSDPWALEGLNEETEEVDKTPLGTAVNAVADMKIIGVREKNPGLTPDLKLDREAIKSQNDVDALQRDLMSRGFLLQPDETPESLKLIAREGELFATANDGLTYRLYFGRAFTGSQEELEIELKSDDVQSADDGDAETESDGEESSTDNGESENGDEEDDSKSKQPGRYVFVSVGYAESDMEDKRPVEPTEPVMPDELKAAEAAEGEEPGEEKTSDEESDGDTEDSADAADEEAKDDPLTKLREEYESAKKTYEVDMVSWQADVKSFEKKVTEAKEKAEKLNRRFADWYYVIPGETFDKLRMSRADLVKEKKEDEESESADDAGTEETAKDEPAADPPAAETQDNEEEADEPSESADDPASDASESDETPQETEEPADESASDNTESTTDDGDSESESE